VKRSVFRGEASGLLDGFDCFIGRHLIFERAFGLMSGNSFIGTSGERALWALLYAESARIFHLFPLLPVCGMVRHSPACESFADLSALEEFRMGFTKLFGVVVVCFLGCARVEAQDDGSALEESGASQDDAPGQQGQALQIATVNRVVVEGALIGRQKIAYVDSGLDAPAIVFIHSNSCSHLCWERQLAVALPEGSVNPLVADFRVIALDLPGHGATRRLSDGDNQYSIAFYAEAVAAFANALDLDGAVYVGHSLGGHALIEAGTLLPSPAAALIFGTPPVSTVEQIGAAFFPMPGGPHFLAADLTREDIHHWEATVFYSELPTWFERSVLRTDPLARSGLAASLGVLQDEVQMVRDYPCPIGIVQGEFERSVRLSYLESLGLENELWRGALQLVAEANHFTSYDQPVAFNALVHELATEVN
jgi:pimeloyl-ACP methyl ester carboxylesterase